MKAVNHPPASTVTPLRFPTMDGLAGTSLKHEHVGAIVEEGKQRGFFRGSCGELYGRRRATASHA